MDLLDDTYKPSEELNKEEIAEVYRLRQEHSELKKKIRNAKIAIAIICIFSTLSFLVSIATKSEQLTSYDIIVSLVLIVVFGICAAIENKYAKYSLSVAIGLYTLNLALTFFVNPATAAIGLIVKGFFIYFMAVGLIAALKYNATLNAMDRLNIKPYKY